MKTVATSLLALALSCAAAAAAAQEPYAGHPYGDAPYGNYEHRYPRDVYRDERPQPGDQGAYSDWARVVRVDPVIVSGRGHPAGGASYCRTRRDERAVHDPYARDGGYDAYGRSDPYRDPYASDPYRSDPYRNDPYRNDPYRDARRDENGRMVATVLGSIAGAVLGSKIGDGSGRYVGTAVGSMVGSVAGRSIYESNRRARDPRDGHVTVCDPEPYADGRGAVSEYEVTYEYAGRHYTTRTGYHPGDRIRVRVDVRPE